jgi:hypothetical protein
MARNAQVGILITAKDGATSVIKGTASAVGSLGKAANASASFIARAPIALNQAFGMANKMIGMVDRTMGDAIRTAIEYKDKSDPIVKQFNDLARESDLVKARLGDALLPVFVGLGKGIMQATGKTSELVKENRKLIGTKVLEFTVSLANSLITGVATATIAVARAWQGWRMIVDAVKMAVNTGFEVMLRGIGSVLDQLGKLGDIPGFSGLAASAQSAAESARGLADEFAMSAGAAEASTAATAQELDAMEKQIRSIEQASLDALKMGVAQAQKLIESSTAGANKKLADQNALLEKMSQRKAVMGKLEQRVARGLDEQQSANEQRRVEATNKQIETQQNQRDKAVDAAVAVGGVWADAFASMADGSENASRAMLKAIIASVRTVVMAYAAEAAAAAFKANAGIPVVGIAIATAAAGAAFAIVEGMISKIPAAATGGTVRGGVSGKDSVLAMLMPGEVVYDTKRASVIDRMADAFEPRQQRLAMAGAGGGGVNITLNSRTLFAPSSAESKRQVRDVMRVSKRMR